MADSASLGATASASPFTFACAAHLLHAQAFAHGTPGVQPHRHRYSQLSSHIETIDSAVIDLDRMAAGIDLLLEMLSDSADRVGGNSYIATAMRGLLGPVTQELKRHAAALARTTTRSSEASEAGAEA